MRAPPAGLRGQLFHDEWPAVGRGGARWRHKRHTRLLLAQPMAQLAKGGLLVLAPDQRGRARAGHQVGPQRVGQRVAAARKADF